MKSVGVFAGLLLASGSGAAVMSAQSEEEIVTADPRIVQLIVYGDDPCPPSTEEEIIVCARRPEEDRYRIPAPLREEGQAAAESWTSRVQMLEMVMDTGIHSCSTVGPASFTGCWSEMMRQARRGRIINPEGQKVP